MSTELSIEALLAENAELRSRLEESEQTLRAIGNGEVDAFVVSGGEGSRVFTLKGADQPYRVLVETMNEGAANLSPDGTILYCNSRLAAMLQVPLERLIGTSFASWLPPGDRPRLAARLAGRGQGPDREEMTLLRSDGRKVTVLFSSGSLDISGTRGMAVLLTDISELRRARTELEEEKTLLVELLHRVKNTLAQISSLARIEASMTEKGDVKEALLSLENRISALGRLYATLHLTGNSQAVSLDIYLAEVAGDLVAALEELPGRVSLKLDLDAMTIDSKRASPLGLIINELITNAFKHAFPGLDKGRIGLSLKDRGDRVYLEVSDDGAGLPQGFEPARCGGFGLTLVANLTSQLKGEFGWQGGEIKRFSLDFPKNP